MSRNRFKENHTGFFPREKLLLFIENAIMMDKMKKKNKKKRISNQAFQRFCSCFIFLMKNQPTLLFGVFIK